MENKIKFVGHAENKVTGKETVQSTRRHHIFQIHKTTNVTKDLPGPIALTTSLIVSDEEWVLDSECPFHITPRRDLLSEFVEFEENKVMMVTTHSAQFEEWER